MKVYPSLYTLVTFIICDSYLIGTSSGTVGGNAHGNASFSLLLPGKVLHFNALNEKRRFRDRGNKPGARLAWKELEQAGLGKFSEEPAGRGTKEVGLEM